MGLIVFIIALAIVSSGLLINHANNEQKKDKAAQVEVKGE